VQGARAAAHSSGNRLSTKEAKSIAVKQLKVNQTSKKVNQTLSKNLNKTIGSATSEIIKRKTNVE
jgi:hypothetical protein